MTCPYCNGGVDCTGRPCRFCGGSGATLKRIFLIAAAILALLGTLSSALAATYIEETDGSFSTGSNTIKLGLWYRTAANATGAFLTEVNITTTVNNEDTVYVLWGNGTQIDSSSVSGNSATFNIPLEVSTDYIIWSDASGGTRDYGFEVSAPYPVAANLGSYLTGVFESGGSPANSTTMYILESITIDVPEPSDTLQATLYNNVTGASIGTTTFSNVSGILDFDYFNITSAGFCVTYTGNGTGTNCTASGSGSSTFFNVSTSANITGSDTVEAHTYQALLEIQASQLYTDTSITAFNGTNNLTTNMTSSGILYLKALNGTNNVQVAVPGNHTKNISCIVPSPLQTVSCNATGIHDNYYSFNATDIWNNEAIQNFTLTITNSSLGGLPNTTNTTTGLINFSLLQGYNYFIQFTTENGTWEHTNVTLAANASNQHYEFQVLPAPSIDITIRDSLTGNLITQNITIVLTSNTTGDTVYTATGGYFATDLSPEQYTIKLSNVNYSQSTYVVTATSGSVYFLTAYLQAINTSDVVMQFVDSIASTVTISGAQVSQQTLVNGTWQTISSKLTDITGRTVFGYVDDVAYRFISVASGYQSKEFTLDPVLFSTYTVKMTRTTALETDEDFQSVYIDYTPKLFYDGQQNQVNITFNSPLGTFTSYSYTMTYPGGSASDSGTNIVGETFTVDFNITGAGYLDRVNLSLTYDTSIGSPRTFNYSNLILINPGNTTFIANQDNTFGLGLLERIIIGTAVIVVVAGLVTLGAGPLWGLGMALFLMGVWIYTGFWPWWAAGLSFLVGFALVAGRSD